MASNQLFARRSLRLRLLVLLLVPLFSLAALWAFAAYLTSRDAIGKYEASTAYDRVGMPGAALATALQRERVTAGVLVSSGGQEDRNEVSGARNGTDAAEAGFRRSVLSDEARRTTTTTTKTRLDDLLTRLDGLPGVRSQADAGTLTALQALNAYDSVLDSLMHLFGSVILINDPVIYQQGNAIIEESTAEEFVSRENALVATAVARKGQRLTSDELAQFAQNVNNGRYVFSAGLADMKASLRGPLDRLAASPEFATLRQLEDAIIAGGVATPLGAQAQSWQTAVTPLMTTWSQSTNEASLALASEAKPIGDRIMYQLYATAGFGLLAVAASILVSVLFGRSLARELRALQQAALDLAGNRLPQAIKRLRAGERIDVRAEAPPIEVGRSREVVRVAEALTVLHRTALEAALGEARVRQGINQVFLNLAWRSQGLLHRQLSMLDAMERQASDPDALEDLFALDHLTTRMRRHAEGLVILSGSAPARGWHNPVSVRDILRAAIAEVEDYTRVVVDGAQSAALDGSVVADVTHLLAELIENAAAASPPSTQVHVRAEFVATGYAVEIEDQGIGLNDEELADANHRLANPPEFDLADSDRLGLFIVGRLAERHGIDVRLVSSPYGGALAVVLIPLDYLAGDDGSDYEHTWADEQQAGPDQRPSVPWRQNTGPRPAVIRQASPDHADVGAPELPRRVRQANLAPQLRAAAPAPPPPTTDDGPTTRPPEETRSLMSSLQQGWQRGREEEDLDE